jgi:hypothetical protein
MPPEGGPEKDTGTADIMSLFSKDSIEKIRRLFDESDLPKKGVLMITGPF